jgi:predicted ATPase with chaperone activity
MAAPVILSGLPINQQLTTALNSQRRMMIAEVDNPLIGAGTARVDLSAPTTLADTGLSEDLITQLVIKLLHFNPNCTGVEIAHRVGLEFAVVEPILETLKQSHQCEVVAGGLMGAPSFRYRITDQGRRRAQLFLEHNQYVGAAPVPVAQYREYMTKFQRETRRIVTPATVGQAVSHLVLSDRVINQIGPAVTSGQSLFIYGAPGNGKTVIAQALHSLLEGPIAIPYALEVEGHIIRLYNPINHEPVPEDGTDGWITDARLDRRWVICRRPKVMVGGELTMQSLDLAYSATTGFYSAPIQLMANGGLLVIDDFGRQACSPRDMLNRWIVPLESGVDFHTLQSGQKFELPFMTLIVFATNIRPTDLVDEAFLRRIQYKIFAESPSVADFKKIFKSCCRTLGATAEPGLVDHLLTEYYRPRQIALRGCHPRDLIKQALSLASYLNRPPHLTRDLLEAACHGYFVDDAEPAAVYA